MTREMLKEAIADAKTIKETAIASAKSALEEAFTPQLTAMFAERLNELELEEAETEEEALELVESGEIEDNGDHWQRDTGSGEDFHIQNDESDEDDEEEDDDE